MGNKSSQSLKQYIQTSVNYSQLVSSTLNLKNESSVSSYNVQNYTLNNGGGSACPCCEVWAEDGKCAKSFPTKECTVPLIKCDTIKVGQQIQNDSYITQSINSQLAQQLSTQLKNTAKSEVENALDNLQQNDLLGGIANRSKQDVEMDIRTEVNQKLDTQVVLNIVNNAITSTVNIQNETLNNCGIITGELCDFSQGIGNTVVIQNILASIADQMATIESLNDLFNSSQTKMKQTQQGPIGAIASAVSDFFKSIGKLGTAIMIGVVVVFVIVLIVGMVMLFKGGGVPQLPFMQQPPLGMGEPAPAPAPVPVTQFVPPPITGIELQNMAVGMEGSPIGLDM